MIATRDGNAGVRDVPSVSGLTHVVTVVHLTERGDTGVKMFRGTQWVLSSTCFNEWLCWFQEEIPNTWLHVWIRGPNQGMICSPGCCCYCFLVSQSCLKLCDSTDYSLPGSSVHRIFSQPRTEPVSPALAGRFFTTVPPGKPSAQDNRDINYITTCLALSYKLQC